MGCLYVLDEPSIGLHQRDNRKLIQTLKRLRDLGNTVIVVEHDEDTIFASDYIVDIGPAAKALTSDRHIPEMQLRNSCRMTFINGSLNSPLRLRPASPRFLSHLRGFHPNPAAYCAANARERGGTSCACS